MLPTFGGTQRLPRLRRAQARTRTAADGRSCSSPQRAREIGFVSGRVVPHDVLLPPRANWQTRIIRHSPLCARAAAFDHHGGHPRTEHAHDRRRALRASRASTSLALPTGDLGEGINAWIERRPPVYAGRCTTNATIRLFIRKIGGAMLAAGPDTTGRGSIHRTDNRPQRISKFDKPAQAIDPPNFPTARP